MTGAPIYLVSACTSGEEFVAAFRRYADKNGLFVPIGEPLPVGARARFAVTLRDGGVMIEGDAEITSSSRTPSALHGRVGMMVRFHTPDAPSKILLDELVKARLAMKPAPPSVAPRPAELPGEPRPVPPAPAGRIDAINALAECVAIGDTAAAAPIGTPSTKFVVPAVPSLPAPAARRPTTAAGPGVTSAASTTGTLSPPSQTMTTVAAPPAGPSSDTYIAAVPPAPPPPRDRALSTNLSAIPHSQGVVPSSPTDIGGLLVDAADADTGDDLAVPTAALASRDDASTRTQVHAGAPRPSAKLAAARPEPDLSATINSPPPDMPELRQRLEQIARDQLAARARVVTPTQPSPPVVPAGGAPRARTPEVEIAEPTDLSVGPPQPPPALDLEESTAPDGVLSRAARKTVLGVAVVPTGEHVAPAAPAAPPSAVLPIETVDDAGLDEPSAEPSTEAIDAAAEPTGISPVEEVLLDNSLDLAADDPAPAPATPPAPTKTTPGAVPPAGKLPGARTPPAGAPVVNKPGDWVMPSARLAGLVASSHELPAATQAPPGAPAQAPSRTKMPTGDWTIALDPQAPDGWSEPAAVRVPPVVGGDHDAMSGQPAVVASAAPLDSSPKRASTHGEDRPVAEPKVQIDPTLIQPLRPMPTDGPLRPMPPDNPFAHLQSSVDGAPAFAPPITVSSEIAAVEPPDAMAMAPTMTVPPLAPPQLPAMTQMPAFGPPLSSHAPAYPMDPSYQMVPVERLAPRPRAATAGGFASEPVMPVAPARRGRLIIVVISAVIAAAIGVGVLLKLTHHEPTTGAPPEPAKTVPKAAAIAPAADHAAVKLSAVPQGAMPHATSATLAAPMASGDLPTAAAPTCFADVASQPAGAEIVVDQTVVGTTPSKIALPCNAPVDVVVRKAHLLAVTRTVTPTADGAPVRVALARPMFLVKVSSMPAGATITMNGKPLGVTPTTIKINAFEPATLSLSKDGYATEAEQVTPKTNGIAVHTVLKKLGRTR